MSRSSVTDVRDVILLLPAISDLLLAERVGRKDTSLELVRVKLQGAKPSNCELTVYLR